MKTIIILFLSLFIVYTSTAQVAYQAVLRDTNNAPISSTDLEVEVSITQNGVEIYSEIHLGVSSVPLGIINLVVGNGIPQIGVFNDIDWSFENYKITISINDEELPASPIWSVPIAEYAKKSIADNDWRMDSSIVYNLENNVGIGLNNPSLKLHVKADPTASIPAVFESQLDNGATIAFVDPNTTWFLNNRIGAIGDDLTFIAGGTPSMKITNNGRIGMGTGEPNQPVHIVAPVNSGLRIQSPNVTEWIQLNMAEGSGTGYGYLYLGGETKIRGNGRTSEFDGKVEVKCLQINGGCDIVEPFESEFEQIEPGTVVVMTKDGIVPSLIEGDNRVIGVVSGANGIQKGMQLSQTDFFETGVDIAIAGRVYVKVIGEVNIGDQLISSATPGVAKSENKKRKYSGNSIGKALSSPDENGFVLMLVNLQ